MSRHRSVRNLDYNAELEDYDGFSDSQDDMTEEQHAQMIDGLEQVRNILGDQEQSGCTDQAIKDALWEFFFDVDKSVVWLLEEKQKREAARERKGEDGKPLPPLPPPEYGDHQFGPGPMGMGPPMQAPVPGPTHHPDYDEYADDGEYYHPDDYGSVDYGLEYNRLSTITERTERSEYSKHYPSARQVAYRDSISSNTEYGAFRDSRFTATPLAPESPLPQDDDSQSSVSTPRQRNALGLEMQAQHDYPSQPRYDQYYGQHEDRPPSPATTESTIPPPPIEKSVAGTPKRSKLSELADSRSTMYSAKSFLTTSSRSFAVDNASILTYPILRPSPASRLSLGSEFTASEASTSDSSHIRRAVDAALEQERLDKLQAEPGEDPGRGSTDDGSSTATETPRPISQQQGSRGASKLALLAQSKAKQPPETIVSWMRPSSATTRRSRVLEAQEHDVRTKFVTPIGNGPTATTAITTSYQSLGNLISRGVSGLPPSFPPSANEPRSTPSPAPTASTHARPRSNSSQRPHSVSKSVASSTSSKPSKLSMKIKQTQQQGGIPEADVIEDMGDPTKPIFLPTAESNAQPSPFASVLLDEDESGKKPRRKRDSTRKSRRNSEEVPLMNTAVHIKHLPAFAFDVPSPDDIVFNARKGTSLAHQAGTRIKSSSSASSRSSSHTVSSHPKRVSSTA